MRKLWSYPPFQHLLDPLPDGSVCKLGLCEGCLPDAKIWGYQVKGGAGASRYPLHSLQGASQCLHVKSQRKARPCLSASPPPPLFSRCLSLCHPSARGGWRLGPLPPLMSLVRHTTCGLEGTSHDPLQSQTAIQIFWIKKPCYLSYGLCSTVIMAVYCIISFCNSINIVW